MIGVIKNLVKSKLDSGGFHDYLFIVGEDKSYFLHRKDFKDKWEEMILRVQSGEKVQVEFDLLSSPKGPRAVNARIIE